MPRAVANSLAHLAHLWDAEDSVRKSVRESHGLLSCGGKPTFHATVKSCAENFEAILPALKLTKESLD